MPEDWLTTDEAARILGVTPGRVHALAKSGKLSFRMAGRTRLIDPVSVHRLVATPRRPGRPLTPASAWAALLSDLGTVDWMELTRSLDLSSQQRYNLKRLIARTSADDWSALARVRARAHRVQTRAAYLDEILRWDGVVRSGVSATTTHRLDLVATGEAEAYTDEETWQLLQREFHLAPSESGNLVLRVPAVPDARLPFVLGREVMPVAVVAVDLLDSGDPRSRRTALQIIEQLSRAAARD
ncbi:helix-turn-helix domain-containing protein [Planotetraspora sp. A-T 1434]|uniref:helix-turn-helix domain-containing protein n=1 Tax=Planotetraspora sp. A-T 1434 TaxID=2979219 RepID=UPI0021BF322A|nr:helix-turn-helix domain-containing protein [Planotetraspora sp. A-T 1434]MCT9929366.1 helix-turn-helix domain-containing protein [Planotetraspora sp. A-T 1434]